MSTGPVPIRLLRCADCGRLDSPGRVVCPGCLSTRLEPRDVDGSGTVATFTTIRRAPAKCRDEQPYDVAVVDLDCGLRVTGRLARDAAPVPIGARVVATCGEHAALAFALER